MKPYKFYSDCGHGWFAVKIKELLELNVITKISSYSYIRGETAYLEEDCDASIFFDAYREKYNCEPNLLHKGTVIRSAIRSYERYNTNKAIDIALTKGKSNRNAEL